jgi:hypothetical protein
MGGTLHPEMLRKSRLLLLLAHSPIPIGVSSCWHFRRHRRFEIPVIYSLITLAAQACHAPLRRFGGAGSVTCRGGSQRLASTGIVFIAISTFVCFIGRNLQQRFSSCCLLFNERSYSYLTQEEFSFLSKPFTFFLPCRPFPIPPSLLSHFAHDPERRLSLSKYQGLLSVMIEKRRLSLSKCQSLLFVKKLSIQRLLFSPAARPGCSWYARLRSEPSLPVPHRSLKYLRVNEVLK